jgi:hypothetical protein
MKMENNNGVTPINARIYQTDNYELFSFYNGNRGVEQAHVKNLLESFNEHYHPIPIVVTQDLKVLDGQHRLEASRQGGYPVTFIVSEEDVDPTQTIRQLNEFHKNFTLPKYMDLYVERGNLQYIEFQGLLEKYNKELDRVGITNSTNSGYKLLFTTALGLFCGREDVEGSCLIKHSAKPWASGSPTLARIFASGKIQVTNAVKGMRTLDYLVEILEGLPRQRHKGKMHRNLYQHLRTREYLCSLHYLLHYRNANVRNTNERFDPDVFLDQVKKHPKKLILRDYGKLWTSALSHIEDLYNFENNADGYVYLNRG